MNKVVLIVVGVLLLGAVGAGAFFLGRGAGERKEAVAEAPKPAAAAPAAPKPAPAAQAAAPAPAPPPPMVTDVAKPANPGSFTIELASFRDLGRAREFLAAMQERKLQVELVQTMDAGGRSWYHVRVGKYDDPRQAAAQLPEVDQIAGIYGIVTTEIPVLQQQTK